MHGVGVPASDTSMATSSWTASRRWWRWVPARRCRMSLGMIGTEAGLSVQPESVMVRLPINVLPTSHQPFPVIVFFLLTPISSTRQMRHSSRRCIYLLGVQCLVSLSDGLAEYTFPLYYTLAVQKPPTGSTEPMRAPGPLDPMTPPETEPAGPGYELCARC
jgi:hypothetical protein